MRPSVALNNVHASNPPTTAPSGTPTLVVAIRGWTTTGEGWLFGRPGGDIPEGFVRTLAASMPHAQFWRPQLDMDLTSMRTPESLADDLFRQLDAKCSSLPEETRIILLGYSAGCLLARRVFCRAHGCDRDGQMHPSRRVAWADRVDRMVVLSGITRGWEFSSASPAAIRFLSPLLHWGLGCYGRWKSFWKPSLPGTYSHTSFILQVQRGAPFVIETRIQYVQTLKALRESSPANSQSQPLRSGNLPSTVFLLGAKDEFISPADCTELGPRAEFVFMELPASNHAAVLHIAGDHPPSSTRRERLLAALNQPFEALTRSPWAVRSTDIDDYLDPMDLSDEPLATAASGEAVRHAVLIVHGIRDHGFWTKRVAREIKRLGRELHLEVRAPTPSYGYFSMWDFVMPGGRERAAYWFMERYADVRVHFPNAKVSFIGHSNGTYIAARALELSPAIQFQHVVFAGSVVRRSYDWSRFQGRVSQVCNYVGHGDGVVAFLPAVFEGLGLRWLDVGGAGAFGFQRNHALTRTEPPSPSNPQEIADIPAPSSPILNEVRFVRGGHGAALDESFWPEMATFALTGVPPQRPPYARPAWLETAFRLAPPFTFAVLSLALVVLALPLLVPLYLLIDPAETFWSTALLFGAITGALLISWATRRFLRQW